MRLGLICLTAIGFLALSAVNVEAQGKDRVQRRESLKFSGYTRPGNPSDIIKDGELIRLGGFEGELKKFKIMGATVYFAVFKNTHHFEDTRIVEGDTFGTGMALDEKFAPGRGFPDASSPRFDRKAKYLYLYQVVNDRSLDPRLIQDKGAKGGVSWPIFNPKKFDPKAEVPVTDDIASFALKLLVDPRYMTSWGYFQDAGFAANVFDQDAAGNPVKNIVEQGNKKIEVDREIRLAFSYMPAIVTKIPDPAFNRRARIHALGKLEAGFGVDNASINMKQTRAYGDLSNVAGKVGADNSKFASFVDGLVKAAGPAKEPDYVQLLPVPEEDRSESENAARAVFRVQWSKGNTLKQGYRSVVFGFTTDLGQTTAPIRIDTPDGVKAREGLRLKDYFAEDADDAAPGAQAGVMAMILTGLVDVANAQEFVQAQAKATGSSFGLAASPLPPPPPAAPAFGRAFAGGFPGAGGWPASGTGLYGSGGFGVPAFGAAGLGGGLGFGGGRGIGGGGGFGGGAGGGSGNGQAEAQQQQQQQGPPRRIDINIRLSNQQTQQQQQAQSQSQRQHQFQRQHQRQGNRHPSHGPAVPAPASLVLALLGLPALLFLRRPKNANIPPTAETIA